MSDLSAHKPNLPGDDDHAAHRKRVEGNLRVARDLNVSGDVVGRDKVVQGYSAEQVQRLIADLAVQYHPRPFDGRCPYPGLESFRESEADLFFGREPLVAELVQRVRASPALIITGPSGNGKSSLVQAGLLPALKAVEATDSSRYATITPGRAPLQALGQALAGLLRSLEAEEDFDRHVLADDTRLARWLKAAQAGHPGQQVVLVVDQFEEIFAHTTSEAERRAFIAQLLTAVDQADRVFHLVLVLRSDFIGACARYPQLNTLLSANLIQVGDLGPGDLLRAVSVPALRVGLRMDPELVSRVIADVRDEPGALPLMQFALRDLFEADRGPDGISALTLEAYLRRGGLHEALRRHADTVFTSLSVEQQALARDILSGLVSVGAGDNAPLTRHTARMSELPGPFEQVTDVVGQLAAGRLIIVAGREDAEFGSSVGTTTVTLAHEKLLDAWPLLANLVSERLDLIRLHSTVINDVTGWQVHEHDASYLYTGTRLAQVWEAIRSTQLKVPEQAIRFLEAAQALEQSKTEAAEATRNAELVRERQVARQLRTRNHWITAAALFALAATVIAVWYAVTAAAQAQQSLALALAMQSTRLLDDLSGRTDRATLLAMESLRRSPSLEANQIMARALYLLPIEHSRMTHDDWVNAVTFSPDGAWVVSASSDHTARVWNAATGQERTRMTHDDGVSALAISPDGAWIVSGGVDGTARVWNATTGQERSRMTHDDAVFSVAFSPDGAWVVSGSRDGTARVWNTATGQERARMTHDDAVTSVAFSPDGAWVVSASGDHTARVWNAATGQERARMTHGDVVLAVAFSPDGVWVVSGSRDGTARVWNAVTGQERARMGVDGDVPMAAFTSVESVAFSPDAAWVVSGSDDGIFRIWDAVTGKERARVASDGDVPSVAFSPDGAWVVSASADGTARVWAVDPGQERTRMTHDDAVTSVAFSTDGAWVVSGSDDHTARVWNAATGQERARMTHDDTVWAVALSPDSKWVVSGSKDGTARVWDAATGQERARMTHDDAVNSVAFSPDGAWVVTGGYDGTARVWDAATGQERVRMTHDDGVSALAISPDGAWIVSGGVDGTARVWNATTGQERSRMTHDDAVFSVAFSPDGAWVVSGSRDGTARVWNTATGQERARMTHNDWVKAVVFSSDGAWVLSEGGVFIARVWNPATGQERVGIGGDSYVNTAAFSLDGAWVVTGGYDGTARVWDAATGQERARMTHGDVVLAVAFSPDGTRIASGSRDETARTWLWRDYDLVALACERIGRNLTKAEWQFYLPGQSYRKTCDQWPDGQ